MTNRRTLESRLRGAILGRVALTSLLSFVAVAPAWGQGVAAAAGRFQASWGREDARALEAMMAPAVRLDVEGEAHLGVPPRQAAATLGRLFDRYAPAAPQIVRHREPEAGSDRGFAEFRWSPLTAQTAEPSPYVIFVVFRSEGPDLRITELRVLR